MIWLLAYPLPSPLPSAMHMFSLSQSSCVSPFKLNDKRGAKSHDREKTWLSINRSILSGLNNLRLCFVTKPWIPDWRFTVLFSIYFMLQEAGVNMQMNVYPASAGYAHPRMYMVRNIELFINLHKILRFYTVMLTYSHFLSLYSNLLRVSLLSYCFLEFRLKINLMSIILFLRENALFFRRRTWATKWQNSSTQYDNEIVNVH